MKIATKMITVLITILLLISLIGLHSIFSNQLMIDSLQKLTTYEKHVDAAAEASSYAKRAEGHLFLYLTLGNELDREKFFNRHNALEEQIAILDDEVLSPDVLNHVNLLKSFSADILEYGNQLLMTYYQNPEKFDFQEHSELLINFHSSTSEVRRIGVTIVDVETTELNQSIEKTQNSGEALQRGMTVIIVILLICVIIVGSSVTLSISKPIKKLRDIAVEIGNGKLGIQNDVKSNNEIGSLANSLNKMSCDLQVNQKHLLEAERHSALEAATWVGHDLRNPLQAIQNLTYCIDNEISLLPTSSPIRQNITSYLKTIDEEIEYSDNIVRTLKDFGSKKEPDLEETNLNTLIKKTLSEIETPKNIQVIKDLGQIPDIRIDRYMMKRVFANLINNSLQAMKKGGKLIISTKKIAGFIEVGFQDTGIGIPKEILEKIFEPFFTTKAKGLGVGLTIVKNFVEKNGGIISVESEDTKGSKFIVKLPLS